MNLPKIVLSEPLKKHLKLIGYLLVSGLLGWILATYTDNPEFTVIFVPVINYILYAIEQEIKNTGFIRR
jgi:hypothetical protein